MMNRVFSRDCFYSGMVLFTCRILIGNISRVTFWPAVSLTEVAEKLALVAFRLFSPDPFDFMPLYVLRVSLQKCSNLVTVRTDWRMRGTLVSSQNIRVVIEFVIDA